MIAIIVNPIAGGIHGGAVARRLALASSILQSLPEAGEVLVTERKGHGGELARAAVQRGARLVVAWGGDGTVNEVASALLFEQTPVGIVPAGSGNGLARALGISSRPELAIAGAVRGAPRSIDAGELGGRRFFSVAGIGFDAHVAACFDRDAAGRRGFVTYARITARELLRYRTSTYRIAYSGRQRTEPAHALLITFANSSQWGNGARIAPRARVDDGRLDLVVFEETSRFHTIRGLPRVFTGSVERLRGVSMQQIESATVESDAPMMFHVDGEPVQGGTRVEARVHPGALSVAVG
jgi:diacylglycerol kinase (ATP)